MVAAGYALYGTATMMVLSIGGAVNGFTLDPVRYHSISSFFTQSRYVTVPVCKMWNICSQAFPIEHWIQWHMNIGLCDLGFSGLWPWEVLLSCMALYSLVKIYWHLWQMPKNIYQLLLHNVSNYIPAHSSKTVVNFFQTKWHHIKKSYFSNTYLLWQPNKHFV